MAELIKDTPEKEEKKDSLGKYEKVIKKMIRKRKCREELKAMRKKLSESIY